MSAEKTPSILRLKNGSIDYRHYEASGMKARNEQIRMVTNKLLTTGRLRTTSFSAIAAVTLLVTLL